MLRKLLHINTMNHAQNWNSLPKIGRLNAIFILGKMPKIEPIHIFSPSFHQKFSMIILRNIFDNECFWIKNFSEKIAFWGLPGGFIIE